VTLWCLRHLLSVEPQRDREIECYAPATQQEDFYGR